MNGFLYNWRYFFIGFGIFLVNLILKSWYLTANDIGHDEPFTLFFAQGSPAEIIQNLIPYNNPPLYELLLHYWIGIFGIDPFEARMFSCLISCIAAVALFFIAKNLGNDRVGIFAVIVFTFSTYQISFAHETRVYSLFFLLSLCSMYYFIRLLESSERKNKLGYVIFSILLLYTHFFSLWIFFVQFIILILKRKLLSKDFIFPALAIILFYLPYIFILFERFAESTEKGTWMEAPTVSALYENIRHFSNQPITAVFVLILFVSGIGLFIRKKLTDKNIPVLLIWFFIPYLSMFLVSYYIPMFLGRYLIFITPAFILLIAVFSDYFWQFNWRFKWISIIVPILFVATVNFNPSTDQEPGKAAKILKPYYEKGTMIVLSPVSLDLQITYHLDRDLFIYDEHYREREKKKNLIPENNVKSLQLPDEMIYVETTGGGYLDKQQTNLKYLKEKYEKVEPILFEGNEIKAFSVFHCQSLNPN